MKELRLSSAILMVSLLLICIFEKTNCQRHSCTEWKPIEMELSMVKRSCCGCGPGQYLAQLCSPDDPTTTKCQPCEPGTYMTEYAHGRNSCEVDNLVCPPGLVRIFAEPDKVPRCDCPPGSYKTKQNTCSPHTPCPPGEGVKVVPSPFRDTQCEICPSGYHSPRMSAADGCTLLPQLIPEDKDQATVSAARSEKCKSTDVSFGCLEMVVISVIASVVLFPLVVVSVWFIFNRCRRQANNSRDETNSIGESQLRRTLRAPQGLKIDRRQDSFSTFSDISTLHNRVSIHLSDSASLQVSAASTESLILTSDRQHTFIENDSRYGSEFSIPQISTPHQRMMNKIKLTIASHVSEEEIKMFFRVFYALVERTNTEVFLENLVKKSSDLCDLFCKIFDQLMKELPEKSFNPAALWEHFLSVSGNKILSDMIKKVYEEDLNSLTSRDSCSSLPGASTRPKEVFETIPETLA